MNDVEISDGALRAEASGVIRVQASKRRPYDDVPVGRVLELYSLTRGSYEPPQEQLPILPQDTKTVYRAPQTQEKTSSLDARAERHQQILNTFGREVFGNRRTQEYTPTVVYKMPDRAPQAPSQQQSFEAPTPERPQLLHEALLRSVGWEPRGGWDNYRANSLANKF